jgi:glycosyltransferase involved in cell wall biosynthesis
LISLSIITINYNNSDGLQKTIKSVINQKYRDFEFIIIDGGSSDESYDIIKSYSDNIDFWSSEPDSGIYNAMNKGILKAKGDYCFFLNSGDYFIDENVLENIFTNKLKEDILFGNLIVCLNGKVVGRCQGKITLSFADVYSSLVKHQATFIKRQLFDIFGLYNENLKIISDWEFFIKTLGLGNVTYRYLNIDISYFDNDGISNNSNKVVYEERETIKKKYIPTMMLPDYEFLLLYGKYKILTHFWLTNLFLRGLTKIIQLYTRFFRVK